MESSSHRIEYGSSSYFWLKDYLKKEGNKATEKICAPGLPVVETENLRGLLQFIKQMQLEISKFEPKR